MVVKVERVHGTYVVTGIVGVIMEGQRSCSLCATFNRSAWMQNVFFGELGGFWQCTFLGTAVDGQSFIGGCGFCFPDYFSHEAIEGLLLER